MKIQQNFVVRRQACILRQQYRRSLNQLLVSIGVAVLTPGEHDSIITLLKTADVALYRAKQLGRNRVELADAVSIASIAGAA